MLAKVIKKVNTIPMKLLNLDDCGIRLRHLRNVMGCNISGYMKRAAYKYFTDTGGKQKKEGQNSVPPFYFFCIVLQFIHLVGRITDL